MAKDLELRVAGDSKSATAALAAAAKEMDRAAREADRMGRAFDAAKRDAEQLDRELLKNAATVKLLAKQYSEADGEIRAGIKQRLEAERKAGDETRRIRKEIIGDTERDSKLASGAFAVAAKEWNKVAGKAEKDSRSAFDRMVKDAADSAAKAGVDSASAFADGFSGLAKNPVVLGIGAALGALLAIPIASAIGGAVIAGAGIGGAGLAALAGAKADKSGRVAAGGQNLLGGLNDQLLSGGKDAIEPLLKGIHELQAAENNLHLDQIIRDAAKYIQPLAAAAGKFADYISQAADILVQNAGPVINAFADELPNIGKAIMQFATDVSAGSQGGADALRDVLKAIETIIIGLGEFIGAAEQAYHAIKQFGDGVTEFVDKYAFLSPVLGSAAILLAAFGQQGDGANAVAVRLGNSFDNLGDSVESGVGAVGDFKNALTDAAQTVDTQWAGAIDAVVGNMLSLDKATLGWDETLTKLGTSIDKNGASLNQHTKEGQKNRDVLLDGVQANLKLFDAQVASGDSAEVAGKQFQAHNDQLRAAAIAAGLNAGEVDKMIQKYGKVPAEIQTQIEMHGLQEALANLDETLRLINHLPPRKTVDIDVNVHGNLFAAAGAISKVLGSGYVSSGLGKRAAGGPVKTGQAYIVGENQAELFVPSVNGMIEPSVPKSLGQSGPSVVSRWGGIGSGGQAITVTLNLAGSDTAMGTALHSLVRGGTVQLRAVDSSGNSLPVKVA